MHHRSHNTPVKPASPLALAHLQAEQQKQNTSSKHSPDPHPLRARCISIVDLKLELMAGAAGNGDLKLLGVWTGLFTIRVRIALNLKGLSYEYVEEDLSKKSALLLSTNPVYKTVPVLLHAGRAINESQIILEYIDEVWPGAPALLPSDPYERATARFWAAYIEDKVKSAWFGMVFGCKDEEERLDAVARAGEAFDVLEGAFRDYSKQGEKPFFGGDGIGFVDLMLGGYLGWFGAVGKIVGRRLIDPAKTPLLAAWEDRFRALDAAKGALPDDNDKVLAFLQVLLGWRAAASSK